MRARIHATNGAVTLRYFHLCSRTQVQNQIFRRNSAKTQLETTSNDNPPEKYVQEKSPQDSQNLALFAKRNEVGVQLLSRSLHSQIFKNVSFPAPDKTFIQISRSHLAKHRLDPPLSSTHPDISFALPPLQGPTIDAHFHSIGVQTAEPYLSLAKDFASTFLPPRPDRWVIQSGWTKYWTGENGLHESVECPNEDLLVFDVETMPGYHQFAIMACAASPTAWYSWISPWLLNPTCDPEHLIPLGTATRERIVVGHNVSYDRARVTEEYNLERTSTRWLDTMALHVAVNGISSHQRPAWSKYRKTRQEARLMKDEAVESVVELIENLKQQVRSEPDRERKADLRRQIKEMEESLPSLQAIQEVGSEREDDIDGEKRWEDLTSANSLADVARLHCDIEVDKSIRNDFMTATPEAILADVSSYLSYCANDVAVTHEVFRKVLPAFLEKCPSPVSFAGMCSMGNSFLTVDENWEHYIRSAEGKYRELEAKVGDALRKLAEEARLLHDGDKWKGDVWLEQLDWSPKKGRPNRIPSSNLEPDAEVKVPPIPNSEVFGEKGIVPKWLNDLEVLGAADPYVRNAILPYLLRLQINTFPVRYHPTFGWHTIKDGGPVDVPYSERIVMPQKKKIFDIFSNPLGVSLLSKGILHCPVNQSMKNYLEIVAGIANDDLIAQSLNRLGKRLLRMYRKGMNSEEQALWWPWLQRLDWTPVKAKSTDNIGGEYSQKRGSPAKGRIPEVPKWYWQLGRPNLPTNPSNIDVTVRSRIAPILLKLKWQGWPLVFSRGHGWTFRVAREALASGKFATRQKELSFYAEADEALRNAGEEFAFFKLPHKDGEAANVGCPLSKTFLKFAADGTLSSPGETAKDALDMNAQCSYWISARDRIMKQMVVWDRDGRQGLPRDDKWGMIIPQVITMGTVTRRAIEKTWLTASNAKANRIGSELKAMVRAPPGYSIVGADVDSEELWISSCMGDAQFGLHGATAIGWMTLEGTKKAGTDLHSNTATILGISRDQAKIFNYSRIYGAGMKHAMLLLLQGNASMLPEDAQKLAEQLYASTKGKNTHRTDMFGRKFWFGGTESFLFNKLEEIALSDTPKTPALGCGVTYALSKQYLPETFGADYLPSRINWVVQSSGVDYLHLLIVSMEHLLRKYDIQARYLISVHDELRYLVKEEDKYRAALALQIANLWTRCLFAYRLGMDDLPQGVAFFSAVDVDKVLRKEVDMSCVTPSQPTPIPPGQSLDIGAVLAKTNGGSLRKDGRPIGLEHEKPQISDTYVPPDCLAHRAKSASWLRAQATDLFEEVKFLAERESGTAYYGGIGARAGKKSKTTGKTGVPTQSLVRKRRVRDTTDSTGDRGGKMESRLRNVVTVETWEG